MSEVVELLDPARRSLDRARLLIEAGRAKDALPLLFDAVRDDPQHCEAHSLLAYAHYALGDYRKALRAAEVASACDPQSEWCHRLRALALLDLKQNRKALLAAQEAARLDPLSSFTLKTLARCQLENGKRKEARKTANLLLEVAPDWSDTHEMLGYISLVEQKWKEGEQHYRQALQLDPQSWSAMNDLALCLQRLRRHKEAVELFHRAAQLNPSESLTRQNLFSSVQGYLGGGFAVLYLTAQFVSHSDKLLQAFPPELHFLARWLLVALVIAVIGGLIWHRRRQLAEIDPTVLAFFKEESRRQRRRNWEQFAVYGSLSASAFICLVWGAAGLLSSPREAGLEGLGLLWFILLFGGTTAGFVQLARHREDLKARWADK